MRSEFEKLFKAQRSYRSSDKEAFIRGCEAAYKHQQSKVDELQKQLIDQGQRFNEQAQRVKDLEHKNGELQKQRDSFIKAYEIEMDKSVELQKNNAWLSGVACRENKRANKLQEENVNTTVLLGKTIQEKNELQKRVDAVNLVLEGLKNANYMNSGNKAYNSLLIEKLEQALKGGEE